MSGQAADEGLLLPPADRCAGVGYHCCLPEARHVGWENGGPHHGFIAPRGAPRPDRIASSSITTAWVCTWCGAECDVWGVADNEWMECGKCGRQSFVCFTTGVPESSPVPSPPSPTEPEQGPAVRSAHD